jgi:hypothetical protein
MVVGGFRKTHQCDAFGICTDSDDPDIALLGVGGGVLLVSTIVGAILMVQWDEAHLRLQPLASSLLFPSFPRRFESARPQGLSVALEW